MDPIPLPQANESHQPPHVPPPAAASPLDQIKSQSLEAWVTEKLRTVFDPEIPVNIYDLGLIYGIDVSPAGEVHIRMTLTSPACPVAGSLPGEVERKIKALEGVTACKVELVWDPPWDRDRMSEAAKLQLGFL